MQMETLLLWPFEENGSTRGSSPSNQQKSIVDMMYENQLDLVINLPMRAGGSRVGSTFVTVGYKTRRMAVDYSVPLITDIKCAKLFIQVSIIYCFGTDCFFCALREYSA